MPLNLEEKINQCGSPYFTTAGRLRNPSAQQASIIEN